MPATEPYSVHTLSYRYELINDVKEYVKKYAFITLEVLSVPRLKELIWVPPSLNYSTISFNTILFTVPTVLILTVNVHESRFDEVSAYRAGILLVCAHEKPASYVPKPKVKLRRCMHYSVPLFCALMLFLTLLVFYAHFFGMSCKLVWHAIFKNLVRVILLNLAIVMH